jgi:hypothetical protein
MKESAASVFMVATDGEDEDGTYLQNVGKFLSFYVVSKLSTQ